MTRKKVEIGENSVTDNCEFAWAVLNERTDIKVGNVLYDYDDMQNGQIPLHISVSNAGTIPVSEYHVSVKDADGKDLFSEQFNETILAGESKDITIMLPLENIKSVVELTVCIGETAEIVNDSETFTIGYADLEIYAESIKVGQQNTLVCMVTNSGLSAASGELLVYEGDKNNIVSVGAITNLAPGNMCTFVVDLDNTAPERILTCLVKPFQEDYLLANNEESVYFDFSAFTEAECEHRYTNDCDVFCDECGAIREFSAEALTVIQEGVYHSITIEEKTGNGLAFRFAMNVDGVERVGSRYTPGTGTIQLHGETHTLKRMGAVVSNDADATLDLEHLEDIRTVNIEALYLQEIDESSVAFAVRVINIPESGYGVTVYARPYYIYECDGEEVVVYGDVDMTSYQQEVEKTET